MKKGDGKGEGEWRERDSEELEFSMGTKDRGLAGFVAPTFVHDKLLAFHVHIYTNFGIN